MKRLMSVFLICFLVLSSIISITAYAQEEKVYYLFGYINGSNYACEEDYQNMGEYRFTDGKLIARFDKVSYVAVKEADNANWYMTDGWAGDVHSVQLLNTEITLENSNKLKVPEGVDVNFTLTENSDGSLTLSYTAENEGYPIRAQLWDYVNIEVKQIIEATGNYWTEETEKPFLQALKEAEEVLDNKNATDKELVNAYHKLVTAVNNLKIQDKEYWINKLIALTAEYSCDFENIEYMYTIYTKESFDDYYDAYKNANDAISNGELFWYDLSRVYYSLADSRKNLKRLDGTGNNDTQPYYKSDEFKTLLSAYGKEIGIGANVMNNDEAEKERTLDKKTVIEYRGLRFFKSIEGVNVFGLSDMLCTVGEEVIDGYKFANPVFDGTEKNKTGLCVYYNGIILSIKDAVNEGIVSAEKLAKVIPYTEKGGTIPTVPETVEKPTTLPVTLPTENERPTMPEIIPDDTGGNYVADNDKPTDPAENESAPPATIEPTEKPSELTIESTEAVVISEPTTNAPTDADKESTEPTQPMTDITTAPVPDNTEPTEPTSIAVTEIVPGVTVPLATEAEQPLSSDSKVTAKKGNSIKIRVKTKTVKLKKLKKKKVTVTPLTIKNAKGKVMVAKIKNGTSAKIFKKITVNCKTGAITFKKGKYQKKNCHIKLKISAGGNSAYKSKIIYKTVKVRIK